MPQPNEHPPSALDREADASVDAHGRPAWTLRAEDKDGDQ